MLKLNKLIQYESLGGNVANLSYKHILFYIANFVTHVTSGQNLLGRFSIYLFFELKITHMNMIGSFQITFTLKAPYKHLNI